MISLEKVRALVAGLGIVDDEHVYMGVLNTKKDCSIGCYNLGRAGTYQPSIGRSGTYASRAYSFLVHWNKSPRQTESAAQQLYESLAAVRDATVNETRILFIHPVQDAPIDVGKDEYGICEMVIEANVYFEEREQ